MASYRFLAADLVTKEIRDEIPFLSCNYGRVFQKEGPFSATIQARHFKATPLNLDPARTCIYIERNGRIIGDGLVWDGRVSEGENKILSLQGASLASYFGKRRLRENRDYEGLDEAYIVQDLVGYTQAEASTLYGQTKGSGPGVALDIVSEVQPTGFIRERHYKGRDRATILTRLQQLSSVIDGPVWWIQCQWNEGLTEVERKLYVRPADSGIVLPEPFIYGTNLHDYSFGRQGSSVENLHDSVGAGEGDAAPIETVSDPNLLGIYPQFDGALKHDVESREDLNRYAQARIEQRKRPPTIVSGVMRTGSTPRLSSYKPGDIGRIVIDDGWTQIDAFRRIVSIKVKVDSDFNEEIKVGFDLLEEQ